MKIIYLIAALALLVGMIPVTAVPVSADTPHLVAYLVDPLTGATTAVDGDNLHGINVTGTQIRIVPVGLNGATVTSWAVTPYNSQAQTVASAIGAEGVAFIQLSGGVGEASITANLSTGGPIDWDKKWAQIFDTHITGNSSVPVTWNEGLKVFRGQANVTDVITGDVINKDNQHLDANLNPITPYPPTGYVPRPAIQGAILNFYLVAGNVAVNMAPGYAAAQKTYVSGLAKPVFSSFAPIPNPLPNPYTPVTTVSAVSPANGSITQTVYSSGEESVQVVVVAENPAGGLEVQLPLEVFTINFWTREMEKVPQVRWAGEKIVLEKNWGATYAGRLVHFVLENQSPGALEQFGPVPNGIGLNLTNNSQSVWTTVQANGLASCILVSEDMGEVDVDAGLYAADNTTLLNQHGFVVYYLKLESVTLGNVVGKRAGHNTGLFVPGNPWDPTLDQTTATLNVSADDLLRARVRGWFTNANPSVRPVRTIDYNNSTLDNPASANLTLPAGRWILPDDWATLAGPNWTTDRIHWDIMNTPSDGATGVTATNALGNYTKGAVVKATASVVGPFSPGIEDMTPLGWATPNPRPDTLRPYQTVVPDGKLNYWDAPMPPAKIIFTILANANSTMQAGYFKSALKTDIYYLPVSPAPAPPVVSVYTNPFYQEMIPAHEAIPAFINNGGYDWATFGYDQTIAPYGNYIFWTIINRPNVNAPVATSDPGNHPTVVEVYSDNHGEAMVWLNGNWNLDLTQFLSNGAADVLFGATVGNTTVQVTADYPYMRKHQALLSNTVTKTWTWGGEVLGPDPLHQFPPTNVTRTVKTRMVLTTGTYTITSGTWPNENGTSDKRLIFVWVTDRDGKQAGVLGAKVEWQISVTSGTPPHISGMSTSAGAGVDAYNEITKNIQLSGGFLAGTNPLGTSGSLTGSMDGTQAVSYLMRPQDSVVLTGTDVHNGVPSPSPYVGKTVLEGLFYKFFNSTMDPTGPQPDNYAVAAIEVLKDTGMTGSSPFNVNEKITSPDFGMQPGLTGTVIYNTNANFASEEPIDDAPKYGDANSDGSINMGDVTKIERVILGLDIPSLNADANANNSIDMGDVVKVERTILGLDAGWK